MKLRFCCHHLLALAPVTVVTALVPALVFRHAAGLFARLKL